jgi:hypothetical protein
MCPYFTKSNTCNFFGTSQGDYQKKTFCFSGSNWTSCENYKNRSATERQSKLAK